VAAAAVTAGAGLDLCSRGDLRIAMEAGIPGHRCSFTSPHLDEKLARDLIHHGVSVNLDSAAQAELWLSVGGREAGVRVCTASADTPYGNKFGVVPKAIPSMAQQLAGGGGRLTTAHVHDAHAHRTPFEMAERLLSILDAVPASALRELRQVNLGGGWPMTDGAPAPLEGIADAIRQTRRELAISGFAGTIAVEPGEWVVGPCGWLVATVSAVKQHPSNDGLIVVLDTATPVPCRPNAAPFVLMRDGEAVAVDLRTSVSCAIYGSANTGLDTIGLGVILPPPRRGDVVISCGQGAYALQLTGTFNERSLPTVVVL
jgi:diaminopimelate decarboxylase